MRKYEDLPIEQYKEKHAEYEARGLAIPNGTEVEPTDWADQNGVGPKNNWHRTKRTFIKIGNGTRKGLIKVLHEGNTVPTYYWAGFWKPKE